MFACAMFLVPLARYQRFPAQDEIGIHATLVVSVQRRLS